VLNSSHSALGVGMSDERFMVKMRGRKKTGIGSRLARLAYAGRRHSRQQLIRNQPAPTRAKNGMAGDKEREQ
jgi:hypothetical protein